MTSVRECEEGAFKRGHELPTTRRGAKATGDWRTSSSPAHWVRQRTTSIFVSIVPLTAEVGRRITERRYGGDVNKLWTSILTTSTLPGRKAYELEDYIELTVLRTAGGGSSVLITQRMNSKDRKVSHDV